ncbi:MAG: CBS domain-containing protein [Bacteriovoracaceae bacterium]|nr:CBS domain-containing protein [Bacteriovoracaceae bacterium]
MKRNESVNNVMTKNVHKITLNTKLSEARELFSNNGIHHLPVMSGDQIIGILSYNDLMRIDSGELYNQDPKQADVLLDNLSSVREAMTRKPVTVDLSANVKEVTSILAEGKFHAVPVTEKNDVLVGIITSTDLLKYYLSEAY